MRKLFLLILTLQASLCFAQTYTADRVVARQSLYVRDRWVDSIQTDTAFIGKLRSLPTSDAVFRFVLGRLSGISGVSGSTGGVDSVVMSSSLQVDTILTYKGGVAKVVGLFDRSADGLVSGGQVIYRSGLTYDISAAVYRIGGIRYFSPATTVTLPAANSFLPRKDVIALTTLGTAVVVAGTPSDNPVKPQINPATQLELTFADIEAGAPTPTNVTTNVQYDEGTEWSISTTGTITANTASTAQSVSGTKSIAISSWSNGSGVQFTNSSTVSATNFATFSFWLRLTASLSNQQNITVQFFKSGVAASNAVTASVNKTATNAWQIVSFTIGQFTFSSVSFDRVRITLSGSSSTNTLYIDLVQLQAGVSQTGGAAGGLQNAFVSLTDGTNTVQASGADGLTVAGGDSTITTTVSSALKKLTVALNQAKLRLSISQIDSLRAFLNGKVDDMFSINHHLFKIKNGVTTEVDSLPNLYFKPRQFFGSGADTTDPLTIVRDSSTATPMNVMWMDKDSSIRIGAYPSGSTSGSVTSVFGRTGAISAQVGDYASFYLKLTDTAGMLANYRHFLMGYLTKTVADGYYQPLGSYQSALGGTGIVKSTGGTISYLTDNSSDWNTAYNKYIVSGSHSSGTTTFTRSDGTTFTVTGYATGGGGSSPAIGGSITSATAGSVLYAGTNGLLQQSNSKFFYDSTNARLGLGVNSSLAARLHVVGSGTTSTTISLAVHNSTGTSNSLIVRDNVTVGIGTASPSTQLGIQTATTSGSIIDAVSIWNAGSGAGTGARLRLGYGDNAASTVALTGYWNGTNRMGFESAGTERAYLNQTGFVFNSPTNINSTLTITNSGTTSADGLQLNLGPSNNWRIYSVANSNLRIGANGTNDFFWEAYWASGIANKFKSPNGATAYPIIVALASPSQTANIQEWQDSVNTVLAAVSKDGKLIFNATNTATGTTGARTINKPSGTANIAAGGTSVTVTNSLVSASSIVYCVIRTNDANATAIKNVVPAAGSFTINLTTAPAAEISVGFIVYN
jgi:hypothetical protein